MKIAFLALVLLVAGILAYPTPATANGRILSDLGGVIITVDRRSGSHYGSSSRRHSGRYSERRFSGRGDRGYYYGYRYDSPYSRGYSPYYRYYSPYPYPYYRDWGWRHRGGEREHDD